MLEFFLGAKCIHVIKMPIFELEQLKLNICSWGAKWVYKVFSALATPNFSDKSLAKTTDPNDGYVLKNSCVKLNVL